MGCREKLHPVAQKEKGDPTMNTAQTTRNSQASATPLPIDWTRILSLEPTMKKAAAHLANISGEDFQELYSALNAKIAETAAVRPQFLAPANTDSYIVTFAYRRVISDYRKARAHDAFHH